MPETCFRLNDLYLLYLHDPSVMKWPGANSRFADLWNVWMVFDVFSGLVATNGTADFVCMAVAKFSEKTSSGIRFVCFFGKN